MLKIISALLFMLGLTACNNASFSYPPEKFHNIEAASFSELTTVRTNTNDGSLETSGPKIAYSMGSHGRLASIKQQDGTVTYKFYSRLEYTDSYARGYDTVTDVSGTKLPSTTIGGREGNGGYRVEFVHVDLPLELLKTAQHDGLFLTIAAKQHERNASKRRSNRSFDLGDALSLANEVNGRSNPEYKSNDNVELEVPAGYIRKFLELTK